MTIISQLRHILRRMVDSFDERAVALDLDELDDVAAAASLVIEPKPFLRSSDDQCKRPLAAPAHFLPRRQLAIRFAAKLHDNLGRNFAQSGSSGIVKSLTMRPDAHFGSAIFEIVGGRSVVAPRPL